MRLGVLRRNSRWPQKWRENNFWENSPVYSENTLGVKNFDEIALSCTISEIFTLFYFPLNPRWPPKVAKIEIFPFCIGYPYITLWAKNSLCLLWFRRYFQFFIFRLNPRWPPKFPNIEFFFVFYTG